MKKYVMNYGKKIKCSVNSESEFSDDSGCDCNMVVKFLSCSEQSDSSDDEDNVKMMTVICSMDNGQR
jgi:hypothetical protein